MRVISRTARESMESKVNGGNTEHAYKDSWLTTVLVQVLTVNLRGHVQRDDP